MEKPSFPPLLTAGFHDMDSDGIKSLCVDTFPKSVRRSMLYCNFIQLIEQFKLVNQQCLCFSEVWIDGSFTTEKPEPDDIDILVVVDYLALTSLPNTHADAIGQLIVK